jgi:hypothetical protein
MPDLAQDSADSKRLHAAPRAFSAGLGRPLPARLTDMDAHARARIGALIDARRIRLVRDDDGSVLVTGARP